MRRDLCRLPMNTNPMNAALCGLGYHTEGEGEEEEKSTSTLPSPLCGFRHNLIYHFMLLPPHLLTVMETVCIPSNPEAGKTNPSFHQWFFPGIFSQQ